MKYSIMTKNEFIEKAYNEGIDRDREAEHKAFKEDFSEYIKEYSFDAYMKKHEQSCEWNTKYTRYIEESLDNESFFPGISRDKLKELLNSKNIWDLQDYLAVINEAYPEKYMTLSRFIELTKNTIKFDDLDTWIELNGVIIEINSIFDEDYAGIEPVNLAEKLKSLDKSVWGRLFIEYCRHLIKLREVSSMNTSGKKESACSNAWHIYGRDGHRQKESFNDSYICDFSTTDKTRIIEVFNADITGTNEYTVIAITRDTLDECREELNGQISDGIFENCNIGKRVDIGPCYP